MKEKLTIRKFQHADTDNVLRLWLDVSVQKHAFIERSFWESQLPVVRTHYLPKAETIVALVDDDVVGFLSSADNHIGALFLAAEWQGKGIGTELLKSVDRGLLTVGVYEKNISALQFYLKRGFVKTGTEVQKETQEKVILMERGKEAVL